MATTIRSSTQLYVDANFDFKNNKGVNLSPGTTTGDAVEYAQMNTAISNAITGVGNAIHIPVADLAAAKAVTDYSDRMIMLIETMGLYRYDADSFATSNDNTIIRPTNIASDASPGRWIKMSSTITDHNMLSGMQGGTTGEYYHLTAAEASLLGGSGLSRVDDTNVTLTLGGSPSSALLRSVSLTLGWTGTLADSRITSAATWNAKVGSVTAGAGITQNGTATAPILDIVSAVGTASSVGTIVVTADSVGVALGTTSTTAAAGNHTHAGMGTVTSVTAGDGLTQTGTSTINPTINISGHAGTAGSVGTLVITADSVGVALGTTNITAAAGNHNHNLSGLSDVVITSIADNELLAWDTTTSKWINQTLAEIGVQPTITPAALTKVDDTNVTLTLGGSPTTALLAATSLTLGWTGTLADSRIASAATWNAKVGSVSAGDGLTLSGTATAPILNVASAAGTASTVGTLVITADAVGVALGTTATTAAPGNHNHTIDSLSNTVITSIGDNDILAWDTTTSRWINQTPAELGILTGNQSITLSGDISGTGTTAITTTIGANKVTLAMMSTVATQTFLGRNTASIGNVEVLSVATAKTMLGLTTSNLSTRTYRAVPTGTINGSNTVFTFAANILSGTEEVYKNGILMNAGAGNDYTISYGATTTITFLTAPSSTPFADVILVNYSV